MKGFKSTSANPYTYTQSGVWKAGQYTFQAIVKSDSGYAFAFQKPDLSWDVIDLSWQVQAGQYCSVLEAGFRLEYDAVGFKLIANDVTGEVVVLSPMLEQGANPSTPIAHEEDLRGMDGDFHEFIFTRNDTGIAPDTPLSTQEDDLEPEGWTDNPQGVTKELPFEFVSMREKKVGVWLDYSPPSLWAKWSEDGLSVYLRKQGHYESRWVGTEKVTEIVGGEMFGETELIKVTAVFRKGEEDVAPTESLSRGFQWYVNGVHLPAFDDQHYITLDSTYGDGFADIVKLSYIVNSLREEVEVEVMNISAGMDGIGEEFIFKANNSGTTPPVLPQTTDEGYQDDDYHGDWSDDPVAPTELNQYVWVAKRKKVGGVWEAFGTPSLWTWWVTDGGDAAYWELLSSAPLIYKDAEDASTSGVHTTITLSGRYVEGVTSQNGGYISVQPNGGVEDTPLVSPREFTPPNNAGVDEYVFRLYDDASKTTLLDTLTVPIAFKGEKGVSAINITLSNEADALPATEDGEVTDYTGSGTTIRVFEGSQELSYGTGNGKYQVVATGSNISPDSTPTTNGNARVYGNASNMGAAATAVITFTVSGKTFGGESFSFDKVQNFTKSERGDEGEDGEDGVTIIPNQQGYTYRADLNGNIIGSLANGMVELTIMSGSTPITCSSPLSGGVPTTNGTYRVTRTLGNGITTNSSLSGGKYRITPATLTVDEASVELEIKIMIDGVVTSYPLTLTYRKQFDGADGKSTEFIFKGHISDTTAPTLPSTSQQDDWYGQGTANEWNDDLVEPTKSLPYVWASQRKKVDGVWGAFTTPKVWLRYAEDGEDAVDIRLTATNTQAVIGTSGVTPTEITVTGTAKNTTISGWLYSVDGGSFTTPPNEVTRAGNVVTINTAVAVWRTLAIKAYNTTDNVDAVITISIVGYGAAGEKGKVPIVKEWLSGDTHLNNANVVDFIYYRPTRTWWKLKDEYTSRTATSSPSTTYYEQIPYMSALAVKVLIAEEANLANFVFKGGKLLSIAGTVGGSPATYTGQAGFVHNIVLDGESGTITVKNGEFTGVINATSGKFTGEVNATSGSIGGMHIAGDTIVSENERLVIDGTNNTIYLLDDSGSIKTVIRPNNIPTSVASYFSGSLNQGVSYSGIKGSVTGTTTKDSNTIYLSAGAYEVLIPPITLTASTTHTGGVGSSILSLKLVLSNGISSNDIYIAEAMAISTGGEGYDQVVIPQTKKMITKSGTWRLRLIATAESLGSGTGTYNGSLTSSPSTFNVSEIVNRSEIGSNGMMIATSANNYNFMVGDTFEVRRGSYGLQITNSGIKKWNGTSWVTALI